MSSYMYGCDCGKQTEVRHGMKEAPDIPCPDCGKLMKKLLLASHTGRTAKFYPGSTYPDVFFRERG